MRMKFYLSCFAFLVLIGSYSCKKSTDEAAPDNLPSGDTTKPVPPVFKISRNTVELSNGAGGTDTFYVISEVNWTVSLSAGASAWLSTETVKDLTGKNGTVKLSVIATTTAPQTAIVTITPADTSVAPLQVTVKQKTYSLLWQKCYGGSSDDYFYSTVQLANGQFVSSGFTESTDGDALGNSGTLIGWVINTDGSGNKTWHSLLGGNNVTFSSVAATADGGTISAGQIHTTNRLEDCYITKVDALGKLVWEKNYGGLNDDYANQVLITADGGVIVSGYTNSNDGDVKSNHGLSDLWVIKVDKDGNLVWQKNYGGTGRDTYGVITACSDGGYILCGTTESNNNGDVPATKGFTDILVMKIDANGNKVWSKSFGGSDYDGVASVLGDFDGGCTLAGYTVSNNGDVIGFHGGFLEDAWVLKIDRNGVLKWQAALGGTKTDFATGVTQLPNGNTIIACTTESNDGDVSGNHGSTDIWLVELNSLGKRVWQKTFGSSHYDVSEGVLLTKAGELFVTGFTGGNNGDVSGNHGRSDAWLFKLK
jgi:hypothetical protein